MKSASPEKPELGLTTVPQGQVATQSPIKFDIESIFRLAIEKEGTAETLEKLMGIRRELNAETARKAFDEAMAAFQAECPPVSKTKGVPTESGALAYKYAPFENIIAIVKPCLQRHGFSYTLDTDTSSAPGWVIAICHVMHSGGHTRPSTAKFPLGTKTRLMSDTQVYASALTFASRRVFCNAFGIVTAGEDVNGATARPKPASPKVATEKTRQWMLGQFKDIHVQMQAYAIDNAIIMPDGALDQWPLELVPTDPKLLAQLRAKIEAHK